MPFTPISGSIPPRVQGPYRQMDSKVWRGLQFAMTLIVESIHKAVEASDFDELSSYLLVVREAAHQCGLHTQKAVSKLFSAKNISAEDLKELVDRIVGFSEMQDALGVLEGQVAQRLIDAGQFVCPH